MLAQLPISPRGLDFLIIQKNSGDYDHNHPGHGLHLARTLNPESSSATKIVHCQVSGGNKFILFFNSFIELIIVFHPLNSNSLV